MSDHTFWPGKRVFVTGCTGFLGAWLTAALVELGADVVGLIRDQVPESQLVRSGTINHINVVQGDLCNYGLLERTLAEYQVELVFHLAAQTIVGIANRAPLSTFESNVRGTWLLLEASRHHTPLEGIMIASSDKAYGDQAELPYHEEAPLQGRHPYDVSKSCADLIAQCYSHTYGLPVTVIRCANLYGGGDLHWNRILPGTIRSVLRGERPIIRSDGTFKRDYMFVKDAVRGYIMVAARMSDPAVRGQTFNFGMGQPDTALEVVQTVINISDFPHLRPIILNEVENEIQDQYLCSNKALNILGWKPQYTLESGLRETMAWYRAQLLVDGSPQA